MEHSNVRTAFAYASLQALLRTTFACPIEGCQMRFKQKSQQYSHMRNKHQIDTQMLGRSGSRKEFVIPNMIKHQDPQFLL